MSRKISKKVSTVINGKEEFSEQPQCLAEDDLSSQATSKKRRIESSYSKTEHEDQLGELHEQKVAVETYDLQEFFGKWEETDEESDLESVADFKFLEYKTSDEENAYDPDISTNNINSSVSPQSQSPDNQVPSAPLITPFVSARTLLEPTEKNRIDFFRLLLTDEILDVIVKETNAYAQSLFKYSLTPGARIRRWKETTREELLVFISILFHMGTIALPNLVEYWSTDRYFEGMMCNDWFKKVMSRDRFLLVLKCLHFAPTPTDGKIPDDPLYKIRPLLDHYNKRIEEVYSVGQDFSVNESMVLWPGHLAYGNKYGLKLGMLTEPSGLPLKLFVYTRTYNHVPLDNKKRMYMDNMVNSVDLLIKKNFKGCEVFRRSNAEGICVFKWKDRTDVLTDRRGQVVCKPEGNEKYNQESDASERLDEVLSFYPLKRKTLKWYKKLAIHIFQLMLVDTYHFYNMTRGSSQLLHDFRLHLILELSRTPYLYRPKQVLKRAPLTGHYPVLLEKRGSKRPQLRCRYCRQEKHKQSFTSWYCTGCTEQIGLCVEKCFRLFHEQF